MPEKSTLPSAVRGVGASICTLPDASRGTPVSACLGHCASTGIEQTAMNPMIPAVAEMTLFTLTLSPHTCAPGRPAQLYPNTTSTRLAFLPRLTRAILLRDNGDAPM